MKHIVFGLFTVLLLLSGCSVKGAEVARAEPGRPAGMAWDDPAPFLECIDNSDGITSSLNNCTEHEQMRMDDLLDQEMEAATSKLSAVGKKRLERAQKDWTGQLSHFCFAKTDAALDEVDGDYPDREEITPEERHLQYGTMDMLMYRNCILSETEKRIRELKKEYGNK